MSMRDDNIPLADDDPQGIDFAVLLLLSESWISHPLRSISHFPDIIDESNENHFNRARSTDSLPSMYNDGSSSGAHSLEPDINPDEQEEKARLISQVLELQNTLDGEWFFFGQKVLLR